MTNIDEYFNLHTSCFAFLCLVLQTICLLTFLVKNAQPVAIDALLMGPSSTVHCC